MNRERRTQQQRCAICGSRRTSERFSGSSTRRSDGRLSAVWTAAPDRSPVEIPLETIRAIVFDLFGTLVTTGEGCRISSTA